ncbi:MAG: 4-(cytidine 5'-diphospho)-2-C-methyl-D-erythritol kinase [Cyanobacteriota bacterium]|nr:4-(cytidine 5'-diphospho)-2-C-methyl-D-erythritol kinase [Cyanobacteriota bacterium]
MAKLVVRSPAKINLHLEVLGLRPDGFHELAMVMQTIDLVDHLELLPTADASLELSCDRAELPCDSNNLIIQAAQLLRQRSGLPELGARMRLRKQIPIGAGLAGGSSNGAAALVGLNLLWGLGLGAGTLTALAAELGSDMPFCIEGGCQLCFGRGELLHPIAANATAGLGVLLVKHPQISVSTPWAYGRCRELRSDFYLSSDADFEQRRSALRQGPLLQALGGGGPWPPLRNDLQSVVEPELPEVQQGLALLRQLPTALAVAMSGSGPSLFALFADREGAALAAQALAEPLRQGGFDSWVCTTTSAGVSVMP